MKKVLFGFLGIVSLAGLTACGGPANSAGDLNEPTDTGAAMDTPAETVPSEEVPSTEMPVETTSVSDSDLETTIQENLATLYPDTPFEVVSEAGNVTIVGEIASQEEVDYIAQWVAEMEGVTSVDVQTSGNEESL